MFDDTTCPNCGKTITNDDAVDQDIDVGGAMACADVYITCPDCETRLKVDVEMYWTLSVDEFRARARMMYCHIFQQECKLPCSFEIGGKCRHREIQSSEGLASRQSKEKAN